MKPNKARRRTMLYIPGNNPGMLQNGPIFGADSVLLDLEDSVAATQKDAARLLVASVMKSIDFGATEVTVRVNHLDTPFGMADIEAIVPLQPSAIRFPKIDRPEDVHRVVEAVERIEDKHGLPHDKMKIHPLIETALGVENAFAIGGASPRIDAFSIGGQDLTADLQVAKTRDGEAIDYARRRLVMAAKALKIDVIDTVWADVDDEEGLRAETEHIKKLGFCGKAVINPRQIPTVHEVFTPSADEVRKAERIVREYLRQKALGVGVFAIDGKMIDAPVVARARRTLELACVDVEALA